MRDRLPQADPGGPYRFVNFHPDYTFHLHILSPMYCLRSSNCFNIHVSISSGSSNCSFFFVTLK